MKRIFTILLLGGLATMGFSINEKEKEFSEFLENHLKIVEPLFKETALTYWNATAFGKDEDYQKYSELQIKIREIYSSKDDFKKIESFKRSGLIKDPLLKRQLDLLYLAYLENQVDKELLKKIVDLSTKVEQKFNTFRGKIDDKEVSMNEIKEILKKETDNDKRKKAWSASKQVGDLVAEDLKNLVRLRNRAAREVGFQNYYVMMLALREQDDKEIDKIFTELKKLTDEPFKKLKEEVDSILSKRYRIKIEEMRPWHYHDPFFQEPPSILEVDLDKYYEKMDILKIGKDFYRSIGLQADYILERSDLYERDKKYPHAYCIDIDRMGDVRVMLNLRNNLDWMGTLLHELGHAVYSKNVDSKLPYLLRSEAHIFTTEASAMFFGRLAQNARWMEDMKIIDSKEREKLEPLLNKSLKLSQLVFARWAQVMRNFERELYKNPERDLNALWWDMVNKYQLVNKPEGREGKNDWATKIHICSSPVYYHNYMLGELLASQIHYYISEKILNEDPKKVSYFGKKEVGEWLKKNFYGPGASLPWNELIKEMTGEPLNPKYFVKQFVEE